MSAVPLRPVRQPEGAACSSPIDVAAGLPNTSGLPAEVPHLTLAGSGGGRLVAAGLHVVAARLSPSGQWAPPQELEPPGTSSWVYVSGLEVPLGVVATQGSFHTAWTRESGRPTTDSRVWTARFV